MNSVIKSVGQWGRLTKAPSQQDMCEICGENPKYVENGFKHPYCTRTCARSAKGTGPTACALRGCRSPGNAAHRGFCSEAHGREAVQRGEADSCIQCNIRPQVLDKLCSVCENRVRGVTQTRLREMRGDSATFKSIACHFSSNWNAAKGTAVIDKIYEVIVPRNLRIGHSTYRRTLSSSQNLSTYHSSQCICDLGVNGAVLCDSRSCGICVIVKSCFKEFVFGIPHNTGRYGAGIYTYQDPAIADIFATSCTSSPYRVMIACDVIIPSSLALISSNDGPVFASRADAVMPTYIIMYHK